MSKQQATFDDFFSECYLKYREHIKNYIALRICRPYEAEDLAQDVFVRLWEYRMFVKPDTVWSLLFTIARNIVTDQIRRYYKQEDFVAYIYNKVNDSDRNTTEDVICYREPPSNMAKANATPLLHKNLDLISIILLNY